MHFVDGKHKWFNNRQQNFVSVVNRTLQGYLDQNLSIHKLHLHLWRPGSRPVISLPDKWIPKLAALNIKAFKLSIFSSTSVYYSAVFLAESLEELHLYQCWVIPAKSVRFKSLRTLTLERVQVDCGTFETKTLGCPLLTRLVLNNCRELRNVRLSEAPGLKHFELFDSERREGGSIEIDVPNLETSLETVVGGAHEDEETRPGPETDGGSAEGSASLPTGPRVVAHLSWFSQYEHSTSAKVVSLKSGNGLWPSEKHNLEARFGGLRSGIELVIANSVLYIKKRNRVSDWKLSPL
ncbi:F-box/RNI-like superfamily protein [Striga asiatica]|uniref:F-box/RNI-like superfamily protein n=1 Tax=Striga asiatica TaxID=4170 RepID=A0A5A7QV23_STRAF|nr:F-box/RNI-like superfamily protein [Striga asiatica]